jgi:hypothetical protein
MAILSNDFRSIPSTGIIPDDRVPSTSFAVSYQFSYTATPDPTNPDRSFTGKVVLHVLDSSNAIKYIITIEEKYTVIIIPLAPGLVLYTWNWVPQYEKISGTIGETDMPMTTLGEGTFGVDPEQGFGTSNGPVYIDSRIYSKIFTERLDVGDKIKIKFHNLSAGYVVAKASLALATEGESADPALFDARCGQQIRAFLFNGQTCAVRTRRQNSPLPIVSAEFLDVEKPLSGLVTQKALQGMSLGRGEGGVTFLLGKNGARYEIHRTLDEGDNWKQIMAIVNDVKPLASEQSEDGSTWYVYGINSDNAPAYAIFKNGSKGWTLAETGKCSGVGLPTSRVSRLQCSEGGGLRLMATGGGKDILFFTSNDGKAYSQVSLPKEEPQKPGPQEVKS